VPGQELDEVVDSLQGHLRREFGALDSDNAFSVKIDNKAEPWLGHPGNYIFRTLEAAVIEVWPTLFDADDADGNGRGSGAGGGEEEEGAAGREREGAACREAEAK